LVNLDAAHRRLHRAAARDVVRGLCGVFLEDAPRTAARAGFAPTDEAGLEDGASGVEGQTRGLKKQDSFYAVFMSRVLGS
jgi:hypothetical protein